MEEATASFSVNCFAYALGLTIKEVWNVDNTKIAEKRATSQVKKDNEKNESFNNNKIVNMSSTVLTKDDIEKYIREGNINHPFVFKVPDGCTKIDDKAFRDCKLLKSIIIPNSVEYIGEQAFWNCKALVNVSIPINVRTIGSYAFWSCKSLTNIIIPNGIKIIEKGTFDTCSKLKKITIPNSITEIGECAFQYCGCLTDLILSDSVTKIGGRAFADCSSLTVTIPNNVKTIGEKALDGFTNPKVVCKKGSYCEKYCMLNDIRGYRLTLK